MIKIQDVVQKIIESEEEALYTLTRGFMNLSAYAKSIQKRVESMSHKKVHVPGIVVSLSRLQKKLKNTHPFIQDIEIDNVTVRTPITEMVFYKNAPILGRLSSLYEKLKTSNDDFLTITLSTNEITVICSDKLKENILKHLKEKPHMIQTGLASVGLSLHPKYYPMPNITFSLLRKIAQKRIVLAETITTYTEIIFVCHQKYLAEMMTIFSTTHTN